MTFDRIHSGSIAPFSLLMKLYGDTEMSACWSSGRALTLWAEVESALAQSQADMGVIPRKAADDISAAAGAAADRMADQVWSQAENVGYPILPVVRAIDDAATTGKGQVHLGATTQDIMDSALAMQIRDATDLLVLRAEVVVDLLAALCDTHTATVMAGRTHAQQAVPTTFGAKMAVFLDQLSRCIDRLERERASTSRISLFGAAGTSAALGDRSKEVRERLAQRLGLEPADVPWHVARDALFVQSANAVALSQVTLRLAREVIDLSRTEVGEVAEAVGIHRGASSTMPQKSNPILSEAIIGFAVCASSMLPAMARAMEAGHERSAGEWQIEWQVLPELFVLVSSALLQTGALLAGLRVNRETMRENLNAYGGMLMSEAYLLALAGVIGREEAHELVYSACLTARSTNRDLHSVLEESLSESDRHLVARLQPEDYLGEAGNICAGAVARWRSRRA